MGLKDQMAAALRFKSSSSTDIQPKDIFRFAPDDDQFVICDPADTTKCVRLDAGAVATATTRVYSFPDRDVTAGGGIGSKTTQLSATGGLTLTTASSGATVLFDAVGATAVALPAIAAADVGVKFTFLWTVTATGNHTITAQSGDLLVGLALMGVSGAGDVDAYFPNGSSHLVLTANGSTTGGLKGSMAVYEAVSATQWNVYTIQACTGTQATPFS
jgi:hypothetical protein